MNRLPAEEQQREQRQGYRDVRNDRPRKGLVHRSVKQVRHRHLAVPTQHLADTVIDDDSIVERIAQNREQGGNAGQVKIDLSDRHEADREHDIVHVSDHCAERKLPFEPEPQIDQDPDDSEHQAYNAIGQELAGNAWTDDLDAPILNRITECFAHLADRLLLRDFATRLLCNPDENVVRRTKLLQLYLAQAE